MSDIGEVLSDVHVECQSHPVKDHKVTRFNVKIPVLGNQLCCYHSCHADKKSHSLNTKSHQSADTSSSNTLNDNNLQYDSDGDLVLDRQVQKHNVTENSPVRKKSKVDRCDFVPSTSIGEKQDSMAKCSEEKIGIVTVRQEISKDVKSDVSCDEILTSIIDNNDQSMEGDTHERARYSKIEKFAHECWVQHNIDRKCQYCLTDNCTCIAGTQSSSTHTYSDRLKECKQCSCCQEEYFITIKHSLATRLQDVGQQIWHGSLLLSDYIIHHSDKFTDKVVIDLGAGVGLTSIVTAMFANTVYSTDVGVDVLTLNEDNIVTARTFSTLPHPVGDILVKELDWFQGPNVKEGTKYDLSTNDINNIYNSDILLAADVIYDFDITDAFFNTIKQIMSHPPEKTLYISLEKRMVFTVEYLAVTSPAYNYFCGLLDKLESETKDTDVEYKISKCDLNFQQYFQYNKTKYLELWCVSTKTNTL